MDLGFLDKQSKVTPLLVKLYDSQKINSLKNNKDGYERHELVKSVIDLLDMPLSERESELVADVLISLMRQAALEMRQALAEKLSTLDNVPLRLILQLANDDIDVARPILKNSMILDDLDLIYIIKSKPQEYWEAIAHREVMSAQLINILVDTGDFDTAVALVKNTDILLTEHALNALSDMAQKSDILALPLLSRDEVGKDVAMALYQYVGEALKVVIQEEYGIDQGVVIDAVDEVIIDLQDSADNVSEFMPTLTMIKAAKRYKNKGLLTSKLILASLRRGQIAAFIAQFAEFAYVSPETVLEVLSQQSGQGLAVLAKAHDLVKEDFVSIFLLSNRVRNQGKMVDLNDLTKAINYYTRIDKDMARDILKNSLQDELSQ